MRVHLLKVRQQVMGIHPTLTVSRRLYVSTGPEERGGDANRYPRQRTGMLVCEERQR